MHRYKCSTEPTAGPLANLDEYKLRTIAHNKIQFATSKQLVSCNKS
jgi:hypothetical protein